MVGLGFLLFFTIVAVGIFFFNEKWSFLAFARPWVLKLRQWLGEDTSVRTQPAGAIQQEAPGTAESVWAAGTDGDGSEADVVEEDTFIFSTRSMEPREGTTAPETPAPEYETHRKPKPEFLKPAHLVQDELELSLDPQTLEKLREKPVPGEEEVDFSIETPLTADTQPAEGMSLSIPADGDNIHPVGYNRFEKIIADEDQPVLDDSEILADGLYDPKKDLSSYKYPPLELLELRENPNGVEVNREELEANKNRIVKTLSNYSIDIVSIKATIGPTVTLYEIVPAPGVRISKIKNLEDDIALSLAALGIRIIAPMPGKGTIGIEIPNSKPEIVSFRSLLATEKFRDSKAELPIAIGKTISNEVYVADLTKMPHLLVAGATGQGKSVGLNCIIASLLYKKHPSQIKFVLIDPKKVEMTLYQMLEKHFLAKLPNYEDSIITDNKQVIHVLNSLCMEMDNRYALLQDARVRNISEYNEKFLGRRLNPQNGHQYLPYIVLIIDELADLMMTAGKEIETPIARLAQLARAVGIHLVVATQRPSVNVITGTIKANFPARMSYRVISKVDSRTILDSNGADQLIGRGDVLYFTGSELIRLQNAFIDTDEVDKLVKFISDQRGYPHAYYLPEYAGDEEDGPSGDFDPAERDSMFEEAARLIVSMQQGSTSLIQRRLKLGYNRAGRIMDQMERAGIVGPGSGSRPREVLVRTEAELYEYLKSIV
ncbi:MAG: DNA translocase FtsK [Bacteroidetes bacterium]|nr:DNA translocase FtsK [Bacteroidota bacterium]